MTRSAVPLIALLALACGSPTITPSPSQAPLPTTPTMTIPVGPIVTRLPTPDATAVPTPEATIKEPPTAGPELFTLVSAFGEGEPIPARYTCDGADDQLPLSWSGVPEGTVELALIQHDPDAGGWVHWVVVGIPADAIGIEGPLPEGARHGVNDFGNARYDGPCPPSGNHTYVTTLFALSAPLDLGEAPTARDVRQAAREITIGQAQLRGTYRRP